MPSRGAFNSESEAAADLFTPDEVGFFFNSLSAARQRFGHVTGALSREYSIGPRGPWIVGLIGRKPLSPHELAHFFTIGRSLVTAELGQLQEAGLINYVKSATDGRRVELSLTPLGHEVRTKLSHELSTLLQTRLAGHSKTDIMTAARILSDFAEGHHFGGTPRTDEQ